MVKYCATCGTLNESGWHQDQIGSELWCRVCGTEHTYGRHPRRRRSRLPHLVLLLDRAATEIRQQEGETND